MGLYRHMMGHSHSDSGLLSLRKTKDCCSDGRFHDRDLYESRSLTGWLSFLDANTMLGSIFDLEY